MSFLKNEPARTQVVENLIDALDRAILRHSNDEETFTECILCYEWEGHKEDCPIPAIDKWLSIPEPKIEFVESE